MDQLMNVDYNGDVPRISARELHEHLEIETPFTMWFSRMVKYGFEEGSDYRILVVEHKTTQGNTVSRNEFMISVDMAKQLCMLLRTEKGKLYRQYFLELEKAWNSPMQVMARAIKFSEEQLIEWKSQCLLLEERLTEKQSLIEVLEPKAKYLDEILQSPSLVTMTQVAKDYGMSAKQLNLILKDKSIQYKSNGQWVLYAKYQGKGYVHSQTYQIPGSSQTVMHTLWTQKGREFLYYLLKDMGILPVVERVGE